MSKYQDLEAIENAIREAVLLAVDDLGIDFVRNLSMFPSSIAGEKVELKKAA